MELPTEEDYLELIDRVAEVDVGAAKFMVSVEDHNKTRDLEGAFLWSITPQGHDYWCDINIELMKREGTL